MVLRVTKCVKACKALLVSGMSGFVTNALEYTDNAHIDVSMDDAVGGTRTRPLRT